MTTLIIAAHPDDEVLGAGGTIALLSKQSNVHIAILGEGISSRYDQSDQTTKEKIKKLQDCTRSVVRIFGASSVGFDAFPDNRFDQIPLLEIVKRVEKLIDEFKPETIYTHHPGDLNIDHLITFRAVLTASRPLKGCTIKELYSFEIPSSTEWAFQKFQPAFNPNVYVDISATIDIKIKAMEAYESETCKFPHPRSPEALRIIAQRWGTVIGVEYAEAFELIRSVR